MSAMLCPVIQPVFSEAQHKSKFFNTTDLKVMERYESREQLIKSAPVESCKTNLFFGFFFDGTKNNYVLSEKGLNHSNVARLYDCYPGLSVPGVLPKLDDQQFARLVGESEVDEIISILAQRGNRMTRRNSEIYA